MKNKSISISDLQKQLPSLVVGLNKSGIIITDGKAEVAVLLSIREYRSMKAMIKLAGDPEKLLSYYKNVKKVQDGDLADYKNVTKLISGSNK